MAACSDDPVAVANPEPAVTVVKVPNGSFEEDAAEIASPKGWTVSGDYSAAKVVQGGCRRNAGRRIRPAEHHGYHLQLFLLSGTHGAAGL